MNGGTTATSNTTTQNLTPDQQSLVDLAQPGYQQFAASNPTLPGSASVAPFNANQVAGQNSVLGVTGNQASTVNSAAGANQYLTSGAELDPSSNPALADYQKTAVQPIFDNLNSVTLPQLSSGAATGSGGISANVGGSREGIAQGLATRSANNSAGATEANIANSGYTSGLNALLQSIGQAPTTAAGLTVPGATQSTVGDVQQQQTQAGLTADTAASQFAQWLPYLKSSLLTSAASGSPGGSTTSTGSTNTDPSLLSSVIGGASAAGGLAGGLGKLLPLLMV